MHTRRLTWSTLAVRKTVFSKGKSQSDDVGRSIRCEVQACRSQGSPDFGRSVKPIYTRGADYAHHITTGPQGFSDLPTALKLRPIILLSIFGGLLPFYETTTFDKNNVLDLVPLWGLEWKQVKGCCHQRHTTICLSPLKSQRSLRVPQQAKLHTDPDEEIDAGIYKTYTEQKIACFLVWKENSK